MNVRTDRKTPRRGTVLLMVLVLIPIMALGAYSFTHWMRAESQAAVVATQQLQARWLAESGISRVMALLAQGDDPNNPIDLIDNPFEFAAQTVSVDSAGRTGLYTVLAPLDEFGNEVRFGLADESTKIPLHNRGLELSREGLMSLEGMTEEAADSILDWIDEDDEPRDFGAEFDYYLGLNPPYQPRNGLPQTIGELLLVKGVTPNLLFGEDANLDGLLSPNEDDGNESWPPDNADGALQRGWYPYLTFHSASPETNSQGEEKINIAGQIEEEDQTTLVELFGEEFVAFLTAYKTQNQPKAISELIDAEIEIDAPSEEEERLGEAENGEGERGQGGGGRRGDGEAVEEIQGGQGGGGRGSRGGREQEKITLYSPWTSDNIGEYLETALQELTVSSESVRRGAINVNAAPAVVLRCLPEITEEVADRIASSAAQRSTRDSTPAWLLLENVIELEDFQAIEPFISTGGRVFRVESVGFFETDGPVVRIQAIIDATGSVPVIVEKRELTAQGSAYPREVLLGSRSY